MNAPRVTVPIHKHEGEPLGEDDVLAARKSVRVCVLCSVLITLDRQFNNTFLPVPCSSFYSVCETATGLTGILTMLQGLIFFDMHFVRNI